MTIKCTHNNTDWYPPDYDVMVCQDCGKTMAYHCEACNGQGWVMEDEYECDWVNFGPNIITCPRCNGSGVVKVK